MLSGRTNFERSPALALDRAGRHGQDRATAAETANVEGNDDKEKATSRNEVFVLKHALALTLAGRLYVWALKVRRVDDDT
jgi:hypothetical protein